MKKTLHLQLAVLLLLCSPMLHAQFQNGLWTGKQAYNWYFGEYAALNFETEPPTPITQSQMSSLEGTGTISDAEGNLLFYTDGITIWNKNNEIMQNGEGLAGALFVSAGPINPPYPINTTTQNGLIVPAPGNSNLFYVFSQVAENMEGYPVGLYYSEVDLSLDNGLGAVTVNKNIQLSPFAGETMTAVHHTDGTSTWFITQTGNWFNLQNEFHAFLISSEGLNTTPVVSVAGVAEHGGLVVQMKVSPDGSKLALTESVLAFIFDFPAQCQIFDFDKSTGIVSNAIDLTGINVSPTFNMGVEFSPNNQFLYVTGTPSGESITNLYQVDLLAGDVQAIIESTILINSQGNDGMMQLGPNGKIYITTGGVPQLPVYGVINYPNNKGVACGYGSGDEFGIDLGQKLGLSSIPSFIQSYFESGILYVGGDCPGEEVSFSTIRIPGITNIAWDFGDPESGVSNISTDLEPSHKFTAGGTYTVTAVITSNGAEQITSTQVIILPAPDVIIPAIENLVQCAGISGAAIFDLLQLSPQILNGQDPNNFTITYYATESDLEAGNAIADPVTFTTDGQTVYVKIINNETGCFSIISFELVVNPLPVATEPNELKQCSDTLGATVFNLRQQDAIILAGQGTDAFTVAYFTSPEDIEEGSAIVDPENFISSGQVIYAVVTNSTTACVSEAVAFNIVVKEPVVMTDILSLIGCSPFDLALVAGQITPGLVLSYYTTEQNAISAISPIIDFKRYIVKTTSQNVYVRAEDTEGCAEIYILNLVTGNCEIPRGISPNNDDKNDVFDLSYFDIARLEIFNRYGQQVYSRNDYTNQWNGQTDNGNELPTGTYYYMVQLKDGESKTGWVYINRQVD